MTLTDLPDEELIIAIGDAGARRISMQYDLLPENTAKIVQEITVKILDEDAGTIEFFDKPQAHQLLRELWTKKIKQALLILMLN